MQKVSNIHLNLKLTLGMRIFIFVNFKSLIYIRLYNLLILNTMQKCKKNNVGALKKLNKLYFQEVYSHVNKFAYSIPQYRRQILTISDGMFKVTT